MSGGALHLVVPDPGCGLLNANQRLHWSTKAKRTRGWRNATTWHAIARSLPRGLDRVHIVAVVRWPDKRRRDVHNVMPTIKACIDGLVDYGLIPDDNDKHLIGPDLRVGPVLPRGERLRVELTIERIYEPQEAA